MKYSNAVNLSSKNTASARLKGVAQHPESLSSSSDSDRIRDIITIKFEIEIEPRVPIARSETKKNSSPKTFTISKNGINCGGAAIQQTEGRSNN